ncbi:hypothetical protein LY76DRAFT_172648 [Colletotrichum caudatum]|nr:hypothetical protein LY76DRAFT_172648 [Colletotrichum caudatum]
MGAGVNGICQGNLPVFPAARSARPAPFSFLCRCSRLPSYISHPIPGTPRHAAHIMPHCGLPPFPDTAVSARLRETLAWARSLARLRSMAGTAMREEEEEEEEYDDDDDDDDVAPARTPSHGKRTWQRGRRKLVEMLRRLGSLQRDVRHVVSARQGHIEEETCQWSVRIT